MTDSNMNQILLNVSQRQNLANQKQPQECILHCSFPLSPLRCSTDYCLVVIPDNAPFHLIDKTMHAMAAQNVKSIFPAVKFMFNLCLYRNMWNPCSIHETCLPYQNIPQPLHAGYSKAQEHCFCRKH